MFFTKVFEDTSNENEASIQRQAKDRQLMVLVTAASDFSQENIEDKFQEIVFTLPNLIDQPKDLIVEDIASRNILLNRSFQCLWCRERGHDLCCFKG